jgi:hypothetical protein
MKITGEPNPETATLEDWRAWRLELLSLPRHDDSVRVALAVAEAKTVKVSESMRREDG